jgi:hypothetical protein
VLSGALFSVEGAVIRQVAWLAPARWGYAATASTADLERRFRLAGETDEMDSLVDPSASQWFADMIALGILCGICMVVAYLLTRRSATERH